MVVAAVDNIGVTLAAFFYYMAQNPSVASKLVRELEAASEEETSSSSSADYLDCCIDETLRMLTPVPSFGRVAEKDFKIQSDVGGIEKTYRIPKGSHCFVDLDTIHKDPSLWNNDPKAFRPERFDPSSKEFQTRDPSAFLPFGLYSRTCAGEYLVKKLFMKVLIKHLMPRYNFRIPPGSTPPNLSLSQSNGESIVKDKIGFVTGLAKFPRDGRIALLVEKLFQHKYNMKKRNKIFT